MRLFVYDELAIVVMVTSLKPFGLLRPRIIFEYLAVIEASYSVFTVLEFLLAVKSDSVLQFFS